MSEFEAPPCSNDIVVDSMETESANLLAPKPPMTTTVSEEPKKSYIKADWHFYTDDADEEAFLRFFWTARKMTKEYVHHSDFWEPYGLLSDEEQTVFYDKVRKETALKQARKQFAKDYCSFTSPSADDEKYLEELRCLHQKWENLSPLSRQYYIDQEEQKLLKQESNDKAKKVKNYDLPSSAPMPREEVLNDTKTYIESKYYREYHLDPMNEDQKALIVYMVKELSKVSKEPEMANKRRFQLCLILEKRFNNLSDKERQPYIDIVRRTTAIEQKVAKDKLSPLYIYADEHGYSTPYHKLSQEERDKYEATAKLNRKSLLEEFPDLDDYFRWVRPVMVKSKATKTKSAAVPTQKPAPNDKTSNEVVEGSSGTEKTVAPSNSANHSKNAAFSVAEETKKVNDENDSVDTTPEAPKTQKLASINENAETEPTGSSNTWELVSAETDSQKNASSECDDFEAIDASENNQDQKVSVEDSIKTKKAPTAFMFYKKSMRRQFGKDYGTKENSSQRKKLISDWKNFSDEAKADYFEKERLARISLQNN